MAKAGIKMAPLLQTIEVDKKSFMGDMDDIADSAIKSVKATSDKTESEANKALENVSKEAKKTAKDITQTFEKISGIGEKISGIGDKLTTGVTAPILGIGTALATSAYNMDSELSKMESRLGVTGEEAEKLKGIAKTIYTEGFGESIADSVNVVATLEQQLKDSGNLTEDYKIQISETVMSMAEVFDQGSDEIISSMKLMTDTGLTNDLEEGLDVITRGFQLGGDYSGELLDTMREYAPQFEKLGLSASEAMNYLITGANNGAFSLDKVGDAMKEFSIRAIDGSDSTKEAFKAIGLNAKTMSKELGKGGDNAKEAFKKTLDALKKIEDPIKQEAAGVALFGTMWEDMGREAMMSLADVEGGLENVEGASSKVLEKQKEQKEFIATWRELQDALMPIGTELMDIAKDCLPAVKDMIGDLREFIAGLTDEQKENIIKWGGIAAAIGPVLSVGGNAIETFGNIGKAIAGLGKKDSKVGVDTLKEVIEALKKSPGPNNAVKEGIEGIGEAAEVAAGKIGTSGAAGAAGTGLLGKLGQLSAPLSMIAGGLAVLGVFAKGTADYYSEELIPEVDLFQDGVLQGSKDIILANGEISKSVSDIKVSFDEVTKESVGKFLESYEEIMTTSNNIKNGSAEATEETVTNLTTKLDSMGKTITENLTTNTNESVEQIKQLYTDANGELSEEGAQLMAKIQEDGTAQKEHVAGLVSDISELLKIQAENNGEWTAEQQAEFTTKMQELQNYGIQGLAKTEDEYKLIKDRIAAYNGRMDAEMMSSTIQSINKTYDETVAKNEATYTNTVALADRLLEAGRINEQQHDEMIAKAKEKWTNDTAEAKKEKDEALKLLEESNKDIYDSIDKNTGLIQTNWSNMTSQMTADMSTFATNIGYDLDWVIAKAAEASNAINNLPSYSAGGGDKHTDGSGYWGHDFNGEKYVPYDGYKSILHKGERVLTAEEARFYNRMEQEGFSNMNGISITVNGGSNAYEIARVVRNTIEEMAYE